MKIALCGSIQFHKELRQVKKKLEALGHTVFVPQSLELIEKHGFTNLEMGIAFSLKKKIFVLHSLPQIPYYEAELHALRPTTLDGDIGKIGTLS